MPFHIDWSINIDTYFSYHYPRLLGAFIKVTWPGKHLLLIPLFYYLSNPFLHRMTNFIPTAAPLFPRQLLLPRAARQAVSPSMPPKPPAPGPGTAPAPRAPPCAGPNGPENPGAAPPGAGRGLLIRKQTNPTLLSSGDFVVLVFLRLQGNSRDWRKTEVFAPWCPQDGARQRGGSKPSAAGTRWQRERRCKRRAEGLQEQDLAKAKPASNTPSDSCSSELPASWRGNIRSSKDAERLFSCQGSPSGSCPSSECAAEHVRSRVTHGWVRRAVSITGALLRRKPTTQLPNDLQRGRRRSH